MNSKAEESGFAMREVTSRCPRPNKDLERTPVVENTQNQSSESLLENYPKANLKLPRDLMVELLACIVEVAVMTVRV